MILEALQDWFFSLLYKMQSSLCVLIDFVKEVFYKLCGLDTVVADGENVDLVTHPVLSGTIKRAFGSLFNRRDSTHHLLHHRANSRQLRKQRKKDARRHTR